MGCPVVRKDVSIAANKSSASRKMPDPVSAIVLHRIFGRRLSEVLEPLDICTHYVFLRRVVRAQGDSLGQVLDAPAACVINNWIVTTSSAVECFSCSTASAMSRSRTEAGEERICFLSPRTIVKPTVQIRDMARKFADDVVRPKAEALDRDERFLARFISKWASWGCSASLCQLELGGAGLDSYAYAIVMEELSRGYASVADQCGVVELIGTLLSAMAIAPQQEVDPGGRLRLARSSAYCISESEAGSDVRRHQNHRRAQSGRLAPQRRQDSGFTTRRWPTSGSYSRAPILQPAIAACRSSSYRSMRRGVGRGPKEHKMGQRASQVGALTFDDVELAADALLGDEGRGFHMMMSALEKGRVGIAALAVGIAQAGFEAALDYAQTRKQFGQAIAKNQGLQWMLADMAKEIAAARALVHRAAIMIDNGEPANAACSMAKCFAGDMVVAQTANAVQMFGGSGYIRGFEVERLYRDAKICQIYEGTQQIQRTVIARELFKNGARQ